MYYKLISLMPKTAGFDPDAQAFITAAAITDVTQQNAINTLVVDLKGYSIWTKFKAIYPIVGGSASSHKYNLKDPRDLDAAFRLNYAVGWTHSATGMTPNGATWADTFLTPSTSLSLNSTHISYYSRTQVTSGFQVEMGSISGSNQLYAIYYYNAGFRYTAVNNSGTVATALPNTTGLLIENRRNATQTQSYKSGSLFQTLTVNSVGLNTLKIYLGVANGLGPNSTKQCAFASIGDGLTDTDAANFYTAVQAYQTTLGRSIGTQTVSDADAQAFINAAVIDDQVQANAINNLVLGMKADGLWSKMKAIYPVVGGIASSHSVNLKTPGTYNLTNLNTGWTHSANGMTSLNTFAGTGIQPSTVLALDDSHLSYFTTGFIDSTQACIIGAFNSPNRLWLYSGGIYGVNSATSSSYTYSGGGVKFRIISRLSSTVHKFANNGTIQTGTVNSSARPTANIELARLGGFSGDNFNGICKFASVGDGLTDTDMTNFNTRVTTYQTALSRYN